MNLQIEIANQQFLDVEIDDIIYFVGSDHKLLWQIFRSFYYYHKSFPENASNIYGENGIEIKIDDEAMSKKQNDFYFINSRDAIYQQAQYKKNSLLWDILNSLVNSSPVANHVEALNDELYRLSFLLQKKVAGFADSLKVDLQDFNYLDLLAQHLTVGYLEAGQMTPLNYMSTDELMDEYLQLLLFHVQNTAKMVWLVLYNLDSYISGEQQYKLFVNLKEMAAKNNNLRIIYISRDLHFLPYDQFDIEKTVSVVQEVTQLPDFVTLKKSITQYYPNELLLSDLELVEQLQIVLPLINKQEELYLPGKTLVLLKVLNELLGYETSFYPDNYSLTSAEIEFLTK